MYEGIVEGCEDVAYSENLLALSDLDSSNSSGVYSWFSVKVKKIMLVSNISESVDSIFMFQSSSSCVGDIVWVNDFDCANRLFCR